MDVKNFMQISTKIMATPDITPAKRGRPKAYDQSQVLKAMRDIFWRKGYAATTLDDLAQASGLNRPSLYNGFGEKADIYRQVLDDYVDYIRPKFLKAFSAPGGLKAALIAVFDTSIEINTPQNEMQGMGCFVLSAALIDSLRDTAIAAMVMQRLREMEKGFEWRLRQAVNEGEISSQTDPTALARMATSIHSTLSVKMRAGENVEDIRTYATQMIEILCRA